MKSRGIGVIGVMSGLSLVLAVVAIVWAAFSTGLEVNGVANVQASKWLVKFDNTTGNVTANIISNDPGNPTTATNPTVTATKVGDYEVSFTTPGDSVSYEITVLNEGSFDAKITSITIPQTTNNYSGFGAINSNTLTCTGTAVDQAQATTDATNVCAQLSYTLTYANDAVNNETRTNYVRDYRNAQVAVNDVIPKAQNNVVTSRKMILTLTYGTAGDDDPTKLPSAPVNITNLGFVLTYGQIQAS